MKRSIRLGAVLIVILVTVVLVGARIQAWNPATHIYIAQRVYPAYANSQDLWYGAIAPDMAMYVPDGYSWDSAFWDTHWIATDLRPWAWSAAQRTFARGWVSHNEMNGADHYAHGYPPLYLAGYITFRANLLAAAVHISPDLAHYAIETAVDLRLTGARPVLTGQLMNVAAPPPSYVQNLLTRVFVWWPFQRTTAQTLYNTRTLFDYVVGQYAQAVAAWPITHVPMQNLGVAIGAQMGETVTPEQVEQLLAAALALTADCETAVSLTIKAVSLAVPK